MRKEFILVSTLLFVGVVSPQADTIGRNAVRGVPASPAQLQVLKDARLGAADTRHRGQDGLAKPAEFARFEAVTPELAARARRSVTGYPLSPAQRAIVGRAQHRVR